VNGEKQGREAQEVAKKWHRGPRKQESQQVFQVTNVWFVCTLGEIGDLGRHR
jgi:hypothetical protein